MVKALVSPPTRCRCSLLGAWCVASGDIDKAALEKVVKEKEATELKAAEERQVGVCWSTPVEVSSLRVRRSHVGRADKLLLFGKVAHLPSLCCVTAISLREQNMASRCALLSLASCCVQLRTRPRRSPEKRSLRDQVSPLDDLDVMIFSLRVGVIAPCWAIGAWGWGKRAQSKDMP